MVRRAIRDDTVVSKGLAECASCYVLLRPGRDEVVVLVDDPPEPLAEPGPATDLDGEYAVVDPREIDFSDEEPTSVDFFSICDSVRDQLVSQIVPVRPPLATIPDDDQEETRVGEVSEVRLSRARLDARLAPERHI